MNTLNTVCDSVYVQVYMKLDDDDEDDQQLLFQEKSKEEDLFGFTGWVIMAFESFLKYVIIMAETAIKHRGGYDLHIFSCNIQSNIALFKQQLTYTWLA